MKIRFRRSFRGYHPSALEELIEKLDREYRDSVMEMKRQMASEVQQYDQLMDEFDSLKEEIASYKSIEDEIASTLLKAHLSTSKKAYNAIKAAEETVKGSADRLQAQKEELVRIKSTMEKTREEIVSIADHYRVAFSDRKEEQLDDVEAEKQVNWVK